VNETLTKTAAPSSVDWAALGLLLGRICFAADFLLFGARKFSDPSIISTLIVAHHLTGGAGLSRHVFTAGRRHVHPARPADPVLVRRLRLFLHRGAVHLLARQPREPDARLRGCRRLPLPAVVRAGETFA
jgi:hypothetical protein